MGKNFRGDVGELPGGEMSEANCPVGKLCGRIERIIPFLHQQILTLIFELRRFPIPPNWSERVKAPSADFAISPLIRSQCRIQSNAVEAEQSVMGRFDTLKP